MISHPGVDLVKKIVQKVIDRGLDGIAITEHDDKDYGYRVKKIIEENLDNQILVIPGREITVMEAAWAEMVELFLPDGSVFRFLPHPSYPYPGDEGFGYDTDLLHGIEIGNALHDGQINKEKVEKIAKRYGLVMLQNSDAHTLDAIGSRHTDISLAELCLTSKDSFMSQCPAETT